METILPEPEVTYTMCVLSKKSNKINQNSLLLYKMHVESHASDSVRLYVGTAKC